MAEDIKSGRKLKNELAYSPLTDDVYYIDGKSQSRKLPPGNFIQILLNWLMEGKLIAVGETVQRTLSVNKKIHWEITIKRVDK